MMDGEPGAGPATRWRLATGRAVAVRDQEFIDFARAAAPRLRRTAFLMCRDWYLAQDLTQITLAKMYVSWKRIWRSANLEAYSRRVLMNVLFDQKRRRSDSEIAIPVVPEPATRGGPDGGAALRVTLVDALATLPQRDRAIVILRYWEDHSVDTVAEMLSISASVVKTQSSRSLTRLRDVLGDSLIVG
jgi:RNA polymerase sigma-70 factor (sigma-E family)